MFYPHMLNYFIRFSFCFVLLFLVCFILFFTFILLYIIFPQFSNIIIHTLVTWLASAYYCVLFVSYIVLKSWFSVPYFSTFICWFHSPNSIINGALLLLQISRFRSLLFLLVSISLARSYCSSVLLFFFSIPHHHHQHRAASSLAEAAFSFTSSSAPPLACLPT